MTWTPVDEHDEHLKEIFEQKLGLATVDVLKVTATGKSSYMSFILDRMDFLDLQALCVSVADIPPGEKSFRELIPEDACGKLTKIDPQIYEQTKEAMSTIARYCGDWNLWEMPSLLSSASRTIAYYKFVLIELAQEKYSCSLKQTLEVIMQKKYEEKESWDCEFYNALYITRWKLKALHEAALGRMRQFDLTYQALDLIKLKVMCSEKSVEFLRKHYIDGPTQSPTDESTAQPYACILNLDLQKSIDDTIKPLMQFRKDELKQEGS
ncbi:hypothetical protein FMEXI_10159 [Fusarium mexicanum]|uniref:Uncharacterized protein n=1 Tax=Fusarium mexicanum TaxID=751941 RepID=A0A8H5IHY4_9HYPO|nr:hypothetical protein FMEXI_10159 [Fusarium mexicanum]